jgi:hypothetical protein
MITKTEGKYPNPNYKFIELFLDGVGLGRADIVRGGFQVRPGRKVFKSEEDAAEGLVVLELKMAKRDLKRAQEALKKWTELREKLKTCLKNPE